MSSSPYQPAATLLNKIWDKHVSLKNLVFDKKTGQLTCSKTTYAQVCQVQRNFSLLKAVLENSNSKIPEAKNQGLLYVLLYELLLGPNKKIRGGGALKRNLVKHEKALQKALESVQDQFQISGGQSEAVASFPRYVRVNTCRTKTKELVQRLNRDGDSQEESASLDFYADRHVPDLLVFPPGSTEYLKRMEAEWNTADSNSSDLFVLQDKSSCFSALCLARGFVDPIKSDGAVDWMDACAAPGNKTSHLAALLLEDQKKARTPSTLYAFDRDKDRHKLLKKRLEQFVPTSKSFKVSTKEQDFLETKPEDYPNVRGILLDPTCSGSGIFTSLDERRGVKNEASRDEQRVQSLSNFQLKILEHAAGFPSIQRIVYSTCSVHVTENESVAARFLKDRREEWEIVSPVCLSHWKRRGLQCKDEHCQGDDGAAWSEEEAASMIRASYEDETNGFFVCCFQRRHESSKKRRANSNVTDLLEKKSGEVGLELYDDQFSPSKSSPKKGDSTEKRKRTRNADKDHNSSKNQFSPSKASAKEGDSTKKQKRPRDADNEPSDSKTSPSTVAQTKEFNTKEETDDRHQKKIAKKMEWKKRQREQKVARLQKKQKQQLKS